VLFRFRIPFTVFRCTTFRKFSSDKAYSLGECGFAIYILLANVQLEGSQEPANEMSRWDGCSRHSMVNRKPMMKSVANARFSRNMLAFCGANLEEQVRRW